MKKVFISTPMTDKPPEEIAQSFLRASEFLQPKGYTTFFSYDPDKLAEAEHNGVEFPYLYMLGISLTRMSQCEAAYFCKGWQESRGCRLEHDAAFDYGLDIFFEEEFT